MVLPHVSYYFQPLFKVTGRMCLQLAGLPLWSTHWQLPVNKADPGTRVYSIETTGNRLVYRWELIGMKAEKSTPIFIFQWLNTGKDIATYFSTPTNWFLGHLQGEEHRSTNSCLHTFLLRRTRLGDYSKGTTLLWQIKNKTNVHHVQWWESAFLLFQEAGKLGSTWTKQKEGPMSDNTTLGQNVNAVIRLKHILHRWRQEQLIRFLLFKSLLLSDY